MTTVLYRKLGPNADPIRGQGLNDFLTDLAAVAQAVQTRLALWQGEWWEDLTDGLPMLQGILGVMGAGKSGRAALLIQQRILGTPYVIGLSNVSTTYNAAARALTFQCTAIVSFGGTVSVVGTFTSGLQNTPVWTAIPGG